MRRGLKESRAIPFPACQAASCAVSKQTPENNLELKVTESVPSSSPPSKALISHPPLREEDMKSAKHHGRLFGGPRMLHSEQLALCGCPSWLHNGNSTHLAQIIWTINNPKHVKRIERTAIQTRLQILAASHELCENK